MDHAGIKYIPQPNRLACSQACIAMVANTAVQNVIEACGTDASMSKDEILCTLKIFNIKFDNFRTFSRYENLPVLCILYIEFSAYSHLAVYFNGKFYDPEFGVLDTYLSEGKIRYFLTIHNDNVLQNIEFQIPYELQVLLDHNEGARRKFDELPASKKHAYIRSINIRKDSKEKRAKSIVDLLFDYKSKSKCKKVKKSNDIEKQFQDWENHDGVLFMKRIGLKEKNTIVDFGCGKGYYSIAAANAVGEMGKVYAIEIKSTVLKNLRKRSAMYALNNVIAMKTNGVISIDIGEDSVDVALVYDVLHLLSHKNIVMLIKEICRILKSDAILSVHPCHMDENSGTKKKGEYMVTESERLKVLVSSLRGNMKDV